MMDANALHVAVHLVVPLGVQIPWLSACRCACNASADPSCLALHYAPLTHVQRSCLERARPAGVDTFAGALSAGAAASPGRRCRERQRAAKAEGKIKGRGTTVREKPVCTWGWGGTPPGTAPCRQLPQRLIGMGEFACFARSTALVLDRDTP
jgi:hypothetical protein